MAIQIYTYDSDNSEYVEHSQNGLFTDPIQTSHDGTDGEIVELQLYLANDNINFYYNNLTLQALPLTITGVNNINYPSAFVSFKIIVQNTQPTASQWASVASGALTTFPDIGSVGNGDTGYKPFWIQTGVPSGTAVQNITSISINLQGEENSV